MATSASAHKKLLSVGTKIIAVGRNYAAHAKELGNAVPKVHIIYTHLCIYTFFYPTSIAN